MIFRQNNYKMQRSRNHSASKLFGLFFAFFILCSGLQAHEMNTAYLELRERVDRRCDVLLRISELGSAIHLKFPEGAETLTEPIARTIDGASLETWSVQIPGGLADQTIGVVGLTMSDLLVRIHLADGVEQTLRVPQGDSSFMVEGSPSQLQVAGTYCVLGVEHILGGIDHLLFVLALLILVKGWKRLTGTITMFTVAHSITLALGGLGIVELSPRLVETIIALSIAAAALHNIRPIFVNKEWLLAFGFGLFHGFGFAGVLGEMQLPTERLAPALFGFNVGVELGQLAVIALAWPLLRLLERPSQGRWYRYVVDSASAAICGIGLFWFAMRTYGAG